MFLAFIIYGIGALIFIAFSAVIMYHLLKFGFMGDATRLMAVIFGAIAIGLLVFCTYYLIQHNYIGTGSFTAPVQSSLPVLGR